ncbi:MAG: hypothetical protein HUU28_07155 [Planctomycetaceae bacterium]|nr:hypothetical protein [Planctomycetaceae bacterium]
MPRRSKQAHLTPQRKAAFLEALHACGVVTRAAKLASPDASGSGIQTFRDERKRDPEFARAWDEALEQHAGDLVAELYRRAVVGDQVPIVSPKGEVVGFRTIRSDKLLLEAVRAHAPEFTPRSESTVTAKVSKGPDLGLGKLSPENQDRLRLILEDELAREQQRALGSGDTAPYSALPIEERER